MSTQLLAHLSREYAATGEFLEFLELEAQAMTGGDFAALPMLAQRKSQLADRIAELNSQREKEQLAMGYPAGRTGAQACVASGGPALEQAWSGLLARAALARENNHRNGVMIHTHLDFTRQSISFLQAKGQPLYGADGSHHAGAASGNRLAVG
ncbi:flagella synthesis protein FlgN [Polaromonas sp.]|uniref:flagella synthesis protein FlgN n=1 Tax=Polaromonas sp. TaxID=1869339 RepID=UPI003566B32D